MRIVQSESVDYPLLLDTTSSASTIYERRDIQPVDRAGQTYYLYTEHQYSVAEWLQQRVPQLSEEVGAISPFSLHADKTQIIADGIDTATITAEVPAGAEYCFVTVNGEVAEKAAIENDVVVRAFTAATPGIYRVDFHALNRIATAFIEVIENA